jgi:hypothetical protein
MVEGVHEHYLNIGDMSSGLPLLFHPVYLLASGTLPERVSGGWGIHYREP